MARLYWFVLKGCSSKKGSLSNFWHPRCVCSSPPLRVKPGIPTYKNRSQLRLSIRAGQSAHHHTTTSDGKINGIKHIINLIAGYTGTNQDSWWGFVVLHSREAFHWDAYTRDNGLISISTKARGYTCTFGCIHVSYNIDAQWDKCTAWALLCVSVLHSDSLTGSTFPPW